MGLMCPVPGKQNAPKRAIAEPFREKRLNPKKERWGKGSGLQPLPEIWNKDGAESRQFRLLNDM
jgi:hypothetical protein